MKYLYVLVGSEKGFYCEQTLVSMASLKNVQPDAFVVLLVDNQTDRNFVPEIERIKKYVNEYVVVPVEECIPSIAKSRFIKTSMRKYVQGDFLYIDADTIWNAPVDEAAFTHDVMGVLDGHCLLAEHPLKKGIEEDFKKVDCNPGVEKYVNGGVLFSRDSEVSKNFYDIWHKKWVETSKSKNFIDMPSLNYAIKEIGDVFALLPDTYNVQISRSWEYFFDAKIIHFFTGWQNDCFESPYLFQKKEFWNEVKESGLSESIFATISRPLAAFEKTLGVYGYAEKEFRDSALFGFIADLYKSRKEKRTFYFLEKIVRFISLHWLR